MWGLIDFINIIIAEFNVVFFLLMLFVNFLIFIKLTSLNKE